MMTDFLIIDCPLAYNVVMGRLAMNNLNLVISTKALTIKFLTPSGTGCIRGEQYSARCCYEKTLKMGFKGKKVNIVLGGDLRDVSEKGINHDLNPRKVDCDRAADPIGLLEDVAVSDMDAKKCLKLGKDLVPEVRTQLVDFLKANLDVFAWKHEDMVGIDPEVMSYWLNIDPNHKPVRQKRRPMTVER